MKYYDMVTIQDLGSKAVFESIKNAEDIVLKEEYKRRQMGLDFYYNRDIEDYVKDYFPGTSLSQIPPLPLGKIVSRFSRARCDAEFKKCWNAEIVNTTWNIY